MGELVTIHGTGFGSNPSEIKVSFGAVQGQIKTIANQIIEVRTPAGASYENISVTNISSGLTSYAPHPFFLNYRGEHGIVGSEFSSQTDFTAQSGLYDLCLCDFNNDNKPDVATASTNSNAITLFENNSTPGTISLTGHDITVNARTLHVKCRDLNGDGRSDIVLSEGDGADRIFILTNNGNFNFSLQSVKLTGRKVKRIAIADLDLDGKPEIVVTDTGGNLVSILPNQSSLSTISFAPPMNITIPGALSTDAVEISDMNGDGFPEIITSQYQADSENKLFICLNKGAFDFNDIAIVNVNKAVSNIRIGDLDGDTKPDIAITRLTGSDVSVYLNQSGTELSFSAPGFFVTDLRPVGLDFGDFDGDGKIDISVGSIAKSISVLNNISTSGSASLTTAIKLNAAYINRNIGNADMDGDGKTDIVFTSVDDFSGVPIPASKISVMRNLSCMVPQVIPGGPLNVCTGYPLRLTATAGGGATYEWFKVGVATPLKSGAEAFLDVSTAGEYQVNAISEGGSCARQSNVVTVAVTDPGIPLNATPPDARSNSPVCTDNILNLEVNNAGASEYRWRGPNAFSQTVTTPTISRPDFTLQDAGLYIVEMIAGACVAKTDSTLVEAVSVPDFNLSFSGGQSFCSGSTKILSVTPHLSSGFTYQWYEKTEGLITEATASSYSTTASGEYYAIVTSENVGCVPRETNAVVFTALAPPVAGFDAPAQSCVGNEVTFAQQSTGDPQATRVYQWTFGDGKTSQEDDPATVYDSPNTFQVSLKVSYAGVQLCSATDSKTIEIITPMTPVIAASAMRMCDGESTALSISGSFASVTWSNGDTSQDINVGAAGEYTVTTVDGNGCTASDQIIIEQKPIPVITVSSDKQAIAAGQTVQLLAQGADTYVWSPGRTLNDSTVSNPLAAPLVATIYTVTGSLYDGCPAQGTITIQVSGEVINIVAPILFSPNGDDFNQVWIIEGVENYPDCSLNIFDKRGGKVFETIGYQNNWDGTIKGNPLPLGVYYYVFGCPNKKSLTGTVTVIR